MASLQIKARVDSEQWHGLKLKKETSTEAVQRVLAHYQATSSPELLEINPDPSAAIAVLLHSHKILMQLVGNASIAIPSDTAPRSATEQPADTSALDTNEDDW